MPTSSAARQRYGMKKTKQSEHKMPNGKMMSDKEMEKKKKEMMK